MPDIGSLLILVGHTGRQISPRDHLLLPIKTCSEPQRASATSDHLCKPHLFSSSFGRRVFDALRAARRRFRSLRRPCSGELARQPRQGGRLITAVLGAASADRRVARVVEFPHVGFSAVLRSVYHPQRLRSRQTATRAEGFQTWRTSVAPSNDHTLGTHLTQSDKFSSP
jgi:hypothetical protein